MQDLAVRKRYGSDERGTKVGSRRGIARALLVGVALLAGCQTLSGIPKSAVKAPVINTTDSFSLQSNCTGDSTLSYRYDKIQRNAWINATMGCITDNYNAFAVGLKRSEVGWGISTGILNLVFGVASSLTSSAGVKANYAAASLLVTGTNEVIDKEAFAERTVDALISAMNANRAKAMIPIVKGMGSDIDSYPIAVAHDHLCALQRAGSLMEGLQFVTANAQNAIQQSNDELAGITENKALNDAEAATRGCLTAVLQGIKQVDQSKLFDAYKAVHPAATDQPTVGELAAHIAIEHRFPPDTVFDAALITELRNQGIAVPCGGNGS